MRMMSRIGNKLFWLFSQGANRKPGQSRKGFTLLEVMIATAVLALGATLIYRSYFVALDSFNYYSTFLKVTPWMDEKIWEAQDGIRRQGGVSAGSGQLKIDNKNIDWEMSFHSLGADTLFEVNLKLSWEQGSRKVKLSRSAYAIYAKK